ncbi:hypothetical protein FOL47_000971, partial [Perkinsus chesapeaki]
YAISFDSMAEDAYRLEVFRKNVMFIEETNRRNLSYTLEVNKFTAMTQEEFTREMSEQSTSSSFTHKVETPQNDGDYMPSNFLDGFPSNLNWVQRGLFEAACWLKTGVLPKLSVQEIIDCSWEQGNQGCTNGRRGNVIKYIEDYGITYSEYYPYRAKEQMCQIIFDKAKLALKPGDTSSDDVITVPPTDLGGLFLPLQKGPISVGIDASPEQWKSYKGGILGSSGADDSGIIGRYAAFKNKYAISFDSMAEDAYRLEVFRKNAMFIEETNRKNLSYKLEINQFTAMTQEEFARKMSRGRRHSTSSSFTREVSTLRNNSHSPSNNSLGDFPSDLSWVKMGAVNPPIKQGDCGSCYAIATLGAVEAACWLRTGVLPRLSVQEILDCSWEQGNEGCATGTRSNVIKYIEDYGMMQNEYYPYKAEDQMCKMISDMSKLCLKRGDLTSNDVIRVEPGDLEGLFGQLQKGPMVVIVDAESREGASNSSQPSLAKGGLNIRSFLSVMG